MEQSAGDLRTSMEQSAGGPQDVYGNSLQEDLRTSMEQSEPQDVYGTVCRRTSGRLRNSLQEDLGRLRNSLQEDLRTSMEQSAGGPQDVYGTVCRRPQDVYGTDPVIKELWVIHFSQVRFHAGLAEVQIKSVKKAGLKAVCDNWDALRTPTPQRERASEGHKGGRVDIGTGPKSYYGPFPNGSLLTSLHPKHSDLRAPLESARRKTPLNPEETQRRKRRTDADMEQRNLGDDLKEQFNDVLSRFQTKEFFQSDWDKASFAVFFIFIGMVLLLFILVLIRCCCCCCCDENKYRGHKVGLENMALEP
ncbi:hypothetical protein WMY93_002156 [Mugilogobius chulae]|uniref:Uncharacterized protein n=1 Tax=Mugilogobius chulae TaxID=88201 RepID=A0AAW0PTL0_9GOBI